MRSAPHATIREARRRAVRRAASCWSRRASGTSSPPLKEAGFTDYLVKPVRAASLATRFGAARALPTRLPIADALPARECKAQVAAVLVAEDNEINALLARSLLTKLGHRPTIAANGAEAVEAWRAAQAAGAPYDLVLMDVHMPVIDGLEATRRIRAAEAERGERRTPIIALTANAFAEDRDACLAAGMDGFLVKPLDRERLADGARGIARSRRMPRVADSLTSDPGSAATALSLRRPMTRSLTACAAPRPRRCGSSPFVRIRSARWRVGRMFSCRLTRLMRVPDRGRGRDRLVVGQLANSGGSTISDRGTRCSRSVRKRSTYQLFSTSRRRRDRPRSRRSPTRTGSPCRPWAGGRSAAR